MKGIIVTGGAKRIGKHLCESLANDGWYVFIHYQTSQTAAELLEENINKAGGHARAIYADLSEPAECNRLIDECFEINNNIYGLVNNASNFTYNDFETVDSAQMISDFKLNSIAPLLLSRNFSKHFTGDNSGCIVNLLDNKIWHPNPDYFSYTVSKSALAALTHMCAKALMNKVRVAGIAPGITLVSGEQSEKNFQLAHKMNPLGQGCTPEQIYLALKFILNTLSYNNDIITIDGGENLAPHDRDVAFLNPE